MLGRVLAALLVLAPLGAGAESARSINWPDLVPPVQPLDDPLAGVDMGVRYDLGFVAQVIADARAGVISSDGPEYRIAMQTMERLKARGVDADTLVQAVAERDAEIARRSEMVRPDLDGEVVRLPGYALPLEITDEGVTELLLVPYVGACIHVPPPPPNQIVHVTSKQPYQLDGLFEPVWITGRIEAQEASRALSFVDGVADVATGYSIGAAVIEAYE